MSKSVKKQMQRLGEFFLVYRIQQELTKRNMALTTDHYLKCDSEYKNYAAISKIQLTDFYKTLYFSSVEGHISCVVSDIINYKNMKCDVHQIMDTGRAEKKKGDLIILFEDGKEIEVSLKNYEKPLDRIQVSSGTWKTFLLNFLFNSDRVGINNYKNNSFSTQNVEHCVKYINMFCKDNSMDVKQFIELFNLSNEINERAKNKYVRGNFAEYLTEEVANQWKKDCRDWSNEFIDNSLPILHLLPQSFLINRFFEVTGLTVSEELLILTPTSYMFSVSNSRFKTIIDRLKTLKKIDVVKYGKSIRLNAIDKLGIIIYVDIPFTLNKNGAWHNESTPRYSKIDNMYINPLQRRPEKAKQLNTSVNSWLALKEALNSV